jgi:diazepam-binding inhibitor (GABA receptor modulating acyl-CoA-binding protein)
MLFQACAPAARTLLLSIPSKVCPCASAVRYHSCALILLNQEFPPMSLQDQFTQAQADSKNLSERPDNMTMLKMYALFKQGTKGDATGERPGFTDMVGRAKFDAWDQLKGTSQDDAMQQYVDLVDSLKD